MDLKSYQDGRKDGLLLALKLVKEGGVENLEKEISFRSLTGINTALARKDLDKASDPIKAMVIDTVCVMSIHVLHDEFGFGNGRIQRFMGRFQEKADCLEQGNLDWDDIVKVNQEELGIDLQIRYNDGRKTWK